MVQQKEITLNRYKRGIHIITNLLEEAFPELPENGLLHLFVKHTSAGLTINENADASVRHDLGQILKHIVPENEPYYTHVLEGADDMPAHAKASLIGASVTIPITNHQLNLGTWQGIYFCEFRNAVKNRKLVATVYS